MIDIVDRLKFDATRCEVQFSKGVATNIEDAAAEIERLRAALAPFAFAGYPDMFQSDDDACTEAIVCDAHVQRARAVLGNPEQEVDK
jgi:hypothetical protein